MKDVMNGTSVHRCLVLLTITCAGVVHAAEPSISAQRSVTAVGTQSSQQSQSSVRIDTAAAPVETQIKGNISKPANAGALQSLNPQPLPPAAEVKTVPGFIQPVVGTGSTVGGAAASGRGINQSLNPQPLPPAGVVARPTVPVLQPMTATNPQAIAPGALLNGNNERAIIIVGGKPKTVAEFRKSLNAEVAAKAGAPRVMKSSSRTLNMAGAESSRVDTNPAVAKTRQAGIGSIGEMRCPDHGKGPIKITEVSGKLKPGQRVSIWGQCFGDHTGRVEIIGQFPGGKLLPTFSSWEMDYIEIEIPANIKGAADHAAALTVVTADGKPSSAVQVQYIAAREHVEVPAQLWRPAASFELASTGEGQLPANKAYAGQLARSLRINPQCALDTMDAMVVSGAVTAINGWEQGPLNEANVTLDWAGTCSEHKETCSVDAIPKALGATCFTTEFNYCRVAFQTRAWASCPVGIAP